MILPILVSAFFGTLVMTIFSYLVSRLKHKQYREPEILANLIIKIVPFNLGEKWNFLLGSFAHYLVGLGFVLCYWLLWQYTDLTANLVFGLIAGFASGLVGILIWIVTVAIHPNPPDIDYKGYYGQLLIAHIFFGVGATLAYMLFYA